jgi:hypothetical protein
MGTKIIKIWEQKLQKSGNKNTNLSCETNQDYMGNKKIPRGTNHDHKEVTKFYSPQNKS